MENGIILGGKFYKVLNGKCEDCDLSYQCENNNALEDYGYCQVLLGSEVDNQCFKEINLDKIIYFSVNDWNDWDSPETENFKEWSGDFNNLRDDNFCKENKIAVSWEILDMSVTYCISAPLSYIITKIPEILGSRFQFLYESDGEPGLYGGAIFLEYDKENFGSKYID